MDSIYNHPEYPEFRRKIRFLSFLLFFVGIILGVIFYIAISFMLRGNIQTYQDSDLSVDNNITVNGLTLKVLENIPCKDVEYSQLVINLSSC